MEEASERKPESDAFTLDSRMRDMKSRRPMVKIREKREQVSYSQYDLEYNLNIYFKS